jgi:hypothetical protein
MPSPAGDEVVPPCNEGYGGELAAGGLHAGGTPGRPVVAWTPRGHRHAWVGYPEHEALTSYSVIEERKP